MFTDNYKREYKYWLLFKKNEKKKTSKRIR